MFICGGRYLVISNVYEENKIMSVYKEGNLSYLMIEVKIMLGFFMWIRWVLILENS